MLSLVRRTKPFEIIAILFKQKETIIAEILKDSFWVEIILFDHIHWQFHMGRFKLCFGWRGTTLLLDKAYKSTMRFIFSPNVLNSCDKLVLSIYRSTISSYYLSTKRFIFCLQMFKIFVLFGNFEAKSIPTTDALTAHRSYSGVWICTDKACL